MLMFRDEAYLDPCYLLVVLKRWKPVAKGLFQPIVKRFFGAGRARIGPKMLMFRDEVHLDSCYLLVVLTTWKTVAKGLLLHIERRFLVLAARGLDPRC